MMIVIDCTVPPSANRLWRVGKGRFYKTKRYERWAWEFYCECWDILRGPKPVVSGRFDAEILICPPRKRDCDNSAKALLDTCQNLGIIANDSLACRVTQELVDKDRAPLGCRLRIIPL